MYQFPNQQLYHNDPYEHCQLDIEDTLKQNVNTLPDPQFHQILTQNIASNNTLQNEDTVKNCEIPQQSTLNAKKKGKTVKKLKNLTNNDEGNKERKERKEKKGLKKSSVDTSTFSIEERLVAGVWVHERSYTNSTISEIKHNFRRRFGRDPPSKTTLFAWERKLFTTGNVCDAPRTGRPVNRKSHVSEVAASLRSAPALSLRARALALKLPRTTLHNILRKDLPYVAFKDKMDRTTTNEAGDKPPPTSKKRAAAPVPCVKPFPPLVKECAPSYPAAPPAPAPGCPPTPPPPHMHYVMHTVHTHTHAHAFS